VAHPVRSVYSRYSAAVGVGSPDDPGAADPRRAVALLEEGRTSEAIEIARRGLLTHPRDSDLLLVLGRGLFAQGEFAEARRALVAGTIAAPSDARMCEWLARAMLSLGESYPAVRMLQRAMQLGADDDRVAELYARAHLAWEEKKATPRIVERRPTSRPPPPMPAAEPNETQSEDDIWEALRQRSKASAE